MKTVLRLCSLAVALVLCNPCFSVEKTGLSEQKKSELAKIRADIDELERRHAVLELAVNRRIIETYITLAQMSSVAIPIMEVKAFDPNALYDTVPHIAVLHNGFLEANSDMYAILNGDTTYARLRDMPNTGETKDRISWEVSGVDSRLYKDDSRYREARNEYCSLLNLGS